MLLEKNRKAWRNFCILKVDLKNKSVSFIESPDWNSAQEPTVGDSHKITLCDGDITYTTCHGDVVTGTYKLTKQKKNPQLYHHKWTFVAPDYNGFDIEESKAWSDKWLSVVPKSYKNKIGYKSNWEKIKKEFNLS